ncbi:hypothetical protein ACHAPF_002957 [Botrytis cinerea]
MSQPIHGSNEPLGPEVDGMDHSDSMNATGKKAGEKKRVSRAGTRSVSTLSPAQLARKRANDREAQRNIRLRTKEHIERLEARIEELTCGRESGAELEEARKRNEALEREVRQLSESLAQLRDDDSSSTYAHCIFSNFSRIFEIEPLRVSVDFFGGRGQGICEFLGCQSWRYQAIPGTEAHVKDIEN